MTNLDADYTQSIALADRAHREDLIASNDKFIARMARAVIKGKEKAVPGTFVDKSPPIHARRIRGDVSMSSCGSPAAMCAETGAGGDGARTLR